jgi:CBS domain-containing protein
MRVKDLVAKEIVTVDAEAPIHEIAVKMKERNVGMVPVLSNGIPVGVITDRDLVLRVLAPIMEPHIMTAWDVMTREPACIDENASLEEAVELMRKRAVRRLIVTNVEGKPEAVVSLSDVARIQRVEPAPKLLFV